MTFYLGKRSLSRLEGVHEDLARVVKLAIRHTTVDFTVTEGLRSLERQKELVAAGFSKTMNSRHLTGHAVDLAALLNGKVTWDWPPYYKIAKAMKEAGEELHVPIEWGGDWRSFKDGPHFQLPFKEYPKDA